MKPDVIKDDKIKGRILEKVKNVFNPEFINRIDETVIFNTLSKENVLSIIDLQLVDLKRNLDKIGFSCIHYKKS